MTKTVQYIILFFIAIVVAILIYFFDSSPKSYEFHKKFYTKEYRGIVQKKYIDKKNHGNKTIRCIDINNQNNFRVRTPDGNNKLYEFVTFGDTIIKEKDCNLLRIRNCNLDTILTYELKYPR